MSLVRKGAWGTGNMVPAVAARCGGVGGQGFQLALFGSHDSDNDDCRLLSTLSSRSCTSSRSASSSTILKLLQVSDHRLLVPLSIVQVTKWLNPPSLFLKPQGQTCSCLGLQTSEHACKRHGKA